MKRHVYLISDGTGLTVAGLTNSLITQFEDEVEFEQHSLPYIDSIEKADEVIEKLNHVAHIQEQKPLVFMTMVNPKISERIKTANACFFDLFNTFMAPLEQELGVKSSVKVGKTHSLHNNQRYRHRIEAIDYTLAHDDGINTKDYDKADIILIGVSRCGKTPSCLYMALQFGLLAANYPFTEEDLHDLRLPERLRPYKNKLFGLTIDHERLQQIRSERRPDSRYASAQQCKLELSEVESVYKKEKIPFINSTRYSIEEIATRIMAVTGLKRKV